MHTEVKVLICDPVHEEGTEKLRQAGFAVDEKTTISNEELRKIVSDYDALVVRSRTKVTKEIIDAGKRLKVIGRAGVGLDNINLEAAKERGISVVNTPEAPSDAVAELTVGLMLSLARNIPLADRTMKEGLWIKKRLTGWQLKGKTLGIIGLGRIGRKVARIAKALEMNILIRDVIKIDHAFLKEVEAKQVTLDELLQKSGVVTLHVPLITSTHHMIGRKEFKLMKEGAFIINVSRGSIVDEKALLEVLKSGKLGGAGLDVYEVEPPKDFKLVKLPNVVCTTHVGAQTREAQKDAAVLVAEKIIESLLPP